ncbi:MAG: lipopolysaccharide kinase InaA family protein [Planctomycetota bacterium]|jgi:tRNA A-37 threonylcarbamoyl transferase component Bud32
MSQTTTSRARADCGGDVVFADHRSAALLQDRLETILDPTGAGLEQFKHNPSRTVFRGTIDGQAVYIKHYHSRTLLRRVLRKLGRSDARDEMRFSQFLTQHSVITPRVLAAGWGGPAEWLVTAAVAPAQPGDIWHDEQLAAGPIGQRAIHQATVALAGLIGRMHAAGVLHGDMHCGNILVRTDTPLPQLVLTDLHRARRRRRLSRRSRAANLAHLFHDRFDFTTRSDRLRFLKHYLRAGGAEGTLRGWQLMVEHFAARHTGRQHGQRDRRIWGNNRYFARLSPAKGWRCHVALASKRKLAGSQAARQVFTIEQWRSVLNDPESLLSTDDGGQIVKQSRSSLVVRRTIRLGETDVDVFIKRHRRKRAWKWMLDCVRPSRALRAFQLGHALLTRRIPTALPLAAMERRVGRLLKDNILITEAVTWPRLDDFLETWLARSPTGHARLPAHQQHQLAQDVLWQLGRLLQRLHDNNFAHRDLKASNLFVRWEVGVCPQAVLVDLDGLRQVPSITMRQRFQGLMRLNVSLLQCPAVNHAGQLRMLLGYLRRPGSGRINFKPYWRVLEEWSARKLNQQIRSRQVAQLARRQQATKNPSP